MARAWRNFDWTLLGITLVMLVIGVVMVRSATINTPGLEDMVRRQITFCLAGLVILFVAASVDYTLVATAPTLTYLILVGLLALVEIVGMTQGGAQRWVEIGLAVQPSELAKILVVIILARFLADREQAMRRISTYLGAVLLLALPLVLIYLQPDLGTTLSIAFAGGVMLLIAGLPLIYAALTGVAAAAVAPLAWLSMQDYMRNRILLFLNPAGNPDDFYNVNQALISIGNGGILGQGLFHGSQSQLHFLRVRHTDFIFSVIAEELGFVGAVIVLILFILLLLRLLRIADLARDSFGRLLVIGMTSIIFFQAAVNIGMNLNLLPVTGKPLPFISYGGSSLLIFMLSIGLAESVAMRYRKLEF
ncbi:MAG: rod shape-determining protein RodA [Anaerolineae bacterium]|nr:rod shape-determining protein RodA [Anaerolineae bacterium]